MKRFKYCKECGKEINSNACMCKDCMDIKFHGSKEEAREIARKNFEYIGIKVK
jgi:predicted amidophosphoribosyltransferase